LKPTKKDRVEHARKVFENHTITSRTIVSKTFAVFRLDAPNGSHGQHVEIICASFGDLIVHGDWKPIVFGGHYGGYWRDKINWIGKSDLYYCSQKARIGTGEQLDELDEDELIHDILEYRRTGCIPKQIARDAYDAVKSRWNGPEESKKIICEWDSELYSMGMVPVWSLLHAWQAVRRLEDLLRAEESAEDSATKEKVAALTQQ
jgi:hypothetical protein